MHQTQYSQKIPYGVFPNPVTIVFLIMILKCDPMMIQSLHNNNNCDQLCENRPLMLEYDFTVEGPILDQTFFSNFILAIL